MPPKRAAHGVFPFEQPSFHGDVEGMIGGASVRVPFWPSTHLYLTSCHSSFGRRRRKRCQLEMVAIGVSTHAPDPADSAIRKWNFRKAAICLLQTTQDVSRVFEI
jgi:hypothetical protein